MTIGSSTLSVSQALDMDGVVGSAPGERTALHRGGDRPGAAVADTADYLELRRLIEDAELMAREPLYYTWKFLSVGLMLALAVGLLVRASALPGWVQVLNAVYFGFVFGQIGLLGHDVGHMQVFRSARSGNIVGLVLGNLLLGVGSGWWRESHNGAHHNNPNHFGLDPNIEYYVLAFTPEQGRRKPPLLRWVIRHQAKLITFFACLQMVSLHAQTVDFIQRWRERRPTYCAVEVGLLVLHTVLYLGLIFTALGPGAGLAFVLAHRAVASLYLASIFAPNHKGMPILYGDGRADFMHEQVLTARNIAGSPLTDFWYGGLNYQIEHHLFPSMPRNHLRQAAPLVRDYCASHGLAYHETSLRGAYREMFQQFQHVSDVLTTEQASMRTLAADR